MSWPQESSGTVFDRQATEGSKEPGHALDDSLHRRVHSALIDELMQTWPNAVLQKQVWPNAVLQKQEVSSTRPTFANGDRFIQGGLVNKDGQPIVPVKRIDHGEIPGTTEYLLSNGAKYVSGCFSDSITYPDGEFVSFHRSGAIIEFKSHTPRLSVL